MSYVGNYVTPGGNDMSLHQFFFDLLIFFIFFCRGPGIVIDYTLSQVVSQTLFFPFHWSGRLLDILRGQGQRGLQAFMESLEFYHPEQYTQLTGQQPTQRCSLILGKWGFVCMSRMAEVQACLVELDLSDHLQAWKKKKTQTKILTWREKVLHTVLHTDPGQSHYYDPFLRK